MSHQMISENFSWYEVTHSDTAERMGLDNSPPESLKPAALNTARQMERIRALLQSPIHINSWYRGTALQALPQFRNPSSQHPLAEAVDFVSPAFGTPLAICKRILKFPELIKFDQLILEHTWVHVSFVPVGIPSRQNRSQVLSLLKSGKYSIGLTDPLGKPL